MAMCTPSALRRSRVRENCSMSLISTFSMISISRQSAGASAAASICAMRSTRRGSRNTRPDTFTVTHRQWPALLQALHWRTAVAMTQSVIGPMRPERSASGMNCIGARRPCCGWRQRSNASAPFDAAGPQVDLRTDSAGPARCARARGAGRRRAAGATGRSDRARRRNKGSRHPCSWYRTWRCPHGSSACPRPRRAPGR